MPDLLQNLLGFLGPNKGFGVLVVKLDVLFDGSHQFRHALEHASSDSLAGQFAEETFHQVQPGRTRGREMKVEPGMLGQPLLHIGVIVRPIVVQDHVDVQALRNLAVNLAQELQKLHVPVARVARPDHFTLEYIQGREKAGSAVAFVVVGHRPAAPPLQWQSGLRPVQRLNLRLLVHAQHHRFVRRVQVYPNHVRQFFDESLVLGEFERLDTVGLQAVGVPDTTDRGITHALRLGHRPRGPMRRILGRRV